MLMGGTGDGGLRVRGRKEKREERKEKGKRRKWY